MAGFFAAVIAFFVFIFGLFWIGNYDTRETLRINNERCGTTAALAGAHEWETNHDGECFFVSDGKLEKTQVN